MKTICLIISLFSGFNLYSQNVGIGVTTPSAPLHLKSNNQEILRLDGTAPYISFYNGTSYKGYLWHNGTNMVLGSSTDDPIIISANYNSFPAYFTSNGRLGLGFSLPSERLHVNGNINLSGLLKINGNGGTAGQVLTSNGLANPSWSDAALTNDIRFAVDFEEGPDFLGDNAIITATNYNHNTSAVVIGATSITINHSGLYHFDIAADANFNFSTSQTNVPWFTLSLYYGLTRPLNLMYERLHPASSSNTAFGQGQKVSADVFITAPATVRIWIVGGAGAFMRNITGFMTGYLISD